MVRKDTTAPQDFQKPSILYNLTHKRRRSIVVHSAGFSSFLSGSNFQFDKFLVKYVYFVSASSVIQR